MNQTSIELSSSDVVTLPAQFEPVVSVVVDGLVELGVRY